MVGQRVGTGPHFLVSDLLTSVSYYREKLGFDDPELWGDLAVFAIPSRDGFISMLRQATKDHEIVVNSAQGRAWDAYARVKDADALHAKPVERGATIEYGLTIQNEYDNKEFAIRNPDGHIIALGHNILD